LYGLTTVLACLNVHGGGNECPWRRKPFWGDTLPSQSEHFPKPSKALVG